MMNAALILGYMRTGRLSLSKELAAFERIVSKVCVLTTALYFKIIQSSWLVEI